MPIWSASLHDAIDDPTRRAILLTTSGGASVQLSKLVALADGRVRKVTARERRLSLMAELALGGTNATMLAMVKLDMKAERGGVSPLAAAAEPTNSRHTRNGRLCNICRSRGRCRSVGAPPHVHAHTTTHATCQDTRTPLRHSQQGQEARWPQ